MIPHTGHEVAFQRQMFIVSVPERRHNTDHCRCISSAMRVQNVQRTGLGWWDPVVWRGVPKGRAASELAKAIEAKFWLYKCLLTPIFQNKGSQLFFPLWMNRYSEKRDKTLKTIKLLINIIVFLSTSWNTRAPLQGYN